MAIGESGIYSLRDPHSLQHPLLDLIGVTWLLTDQAPDLRGFIGATPSGLPDSSRLYRRDGVLPRATFVTQVEVIPDRATRLRRPADPYDAGWPARVDDKSVPVRIADHYLRAVYVPAGRHRVEFVYDGPRVVWPLRLSFLGWILCVGLVVAGARVRTLR